MLGFGNHRDMEKSGQDIWNGNKERNGRAPTRRQYNNQFKQTSRLEMRIWKSIYENLWLPLQDLHKITTSSSKTSRDNTNGPGSQGDLRGGPKLASFLFSSEVAISWSTSNQNLVWTLGWLALSLLAKAVQQQLSIIQVLAEAVPTHRRYSNRRSQIHGRGCNPCQGKCRELELQECRHMALYTLAATVHGLSTCMMEGYDARRAKEIWEYQTVI